MMKKALCYIAVCLLMSSCAATQKQGSVKYPRKPNPSSERKAGPAMFLYEQAEEDMDLTNDVIVIPPTKKQEDSTGLEKEQ